MEIGELLALHPEHLGVGNQLSENATEFDVGGWTEPDVSFDDAEDILHLIEELFIDGSGLLDLPGGNLGVITGLFVLFLRLEFLE